MPEHFDPAEMVARSKKDGKDLSLAELRKQGLVMDDKACVSPHFLVGQA